MNNTDLGNISVYVHIPFCKSKCNYCAFYSLAGCNDQTKQSYTNALVKQITALKTQRTVGSIYFGGGTPPVLGTERIAGILSNIKDRFLLSDNCEITVEVNPDTVNADDFVLLKKAGFNRLSLGLQTSDKKELALLGRTYDLKKFSEAIYSAKAAGFFNISTDIIFGLPLQTVCSLRQTIKDALSFDLPHISVYSLSIEEKTPFFYNKDNLNLPDDKTEDEMYYIVCDILCSHGYKHYEISSFAEDVMESKHNLHYWNCGEYIGFGAAAHSYFYRKRFSGIADIDEYIKRSNDFFNPTDYKSQPFLTEEEKQKERIMLGLRTSKGIYADQKILRKSKKYIDNGYAGLKNGFLFLTDKGYRVSNTIITDLIW